MTASNSRFRCADCGHGEHLEACAAAVASGPLAADGELERHDNVEECYVHEDSIQCVIHPDAAVHKLIDGTYHRWALCESCRGTGSRYPDARSYRDRDVACPTCKGRCGEYVPVEAKEVAHG